MVDRRCDRDFCVNSIVGVGVTYLFMIDASVHTKVLSHKKLNRRSFTESPLCKEVVTNLIVGFVGGR